MEEQYSFSLNGYELKIIRFDDVYLVEIKNEKDHSVYPSLTVEKMRVSKLSDIEILIGTWTNSKDKSIEGADRFKDDLQDAINAAKYFMREIEQIK